MLLPPILGAAFSCQISGLQCAVARCHRKQLVGEGRAISFQWGVLTTPQAVLLLNYNLYSGPQHQGITVVCTHSSRALYWPCGSAVESG